MIYSLECICLVLGKLLKGILRTILCERSRSCMLHPASDCLGQTDTQTSSFLYIHDRDREQRREISTRPKLTACTLPKGWCPEMSTNTVGKKNMQALWRYRLFVCHVSSLFFYESRHCCCCFFRKTATQYPFKHMNVKDYLTSKDFKAVYHILTCYLFDIAT